MPAPSSLVRSSLVIGLLLTGCAAEHRESDRPEEVKPLPAGAFEGTLQLQVEGEAPWDIPIWLQVLDLVDRYQIKVQTWDAYTEFEVQRIEDVWRTTRATTLLLEGDRCVGTSYLRAERIEITPADEGMEIHLRGKVSFEPRNDDALVYTGAEGSIRAAPDRTPPRIVPSEVPLAPAGKAKVRFSEPVFFNYQPEVVADGARVALDRRVIAPATDENGDPWLTWDASAELPIWPLEALPFGAEVRASVVGRDFGGLPIEPMGLVGRVIDAPPVVQRPGEENDAMQGWRTFGAVEVVDAALPPLEGEHSVRASPFDPWRLVGRIEVPDTEAPTLVVRARHTLAYDDRALMVQFDGSSEPGERGWIYVPRDGTRDNEISLAAWRGRTVLVAIGEDEENVPFWACPNAEQAMQLDGFTVVP